MAKKALNNLSAFFIVRGFSVLRKISDNISDSTNNIR